jgi:hypothetical protein
MTTDVLTREETPGIGWAWLRRVSLIELARQPSRLQLDRLAAAITEQEDLLGTVMCLREVNPDRHGSLWTQIEDMAPRGA